MYRTVLFDLDGTITDPGEGITNSVAYSLRRLGIAVPARGELNRFVGPPLLYSYETFIGLDKAQARRAVELYREYYVPTGMYENVVYPGIPSMLKALRQSGTEVVLATSKPEPFAVAILEHFNLLQYFDQIFGATIDETRTEKSEVIAFALKQLPKRQGSNIVMVGDRDYDVLGAKKNGLECIGVSYGYGTDTELWAAGAVAIAADVPELQRILVS